MRVAEGAASRVFVEHESLLDPAIVAVVRYALLCALVAVIFVYLRVADESAARADAAERDRARFVQRMEEARLKMLQAQIEPHFLFNTLANVRSLHATAPREAEKMLDNLMTYFAAALPQMRAADSTLGQEAALTNSYLEIQAIRMGRRLAFDVDIPEALANAPFPPLMLLTLVENAIKHGLSSLREGGAVRVGASAHDQELQVRVADSGRGFTRTSGRGTGLANIRARLGAMHGEAGRLSLAKNIPHGVVATITIPLAGKPATTSAQ
jgi:sensor histidine kinase YesM